VKSRKCIYMIGLLLLSSMACSRGTSFIKPGYDFSQVGKIAAFVESQNLSDPQCRETSDLFAMELLKRGWDVIDRANLDGIIAESEFQNTSGLTSPLGRQQLAIHNVGALILANIPQFGDQISMTAKMVDVQSGSILWIGEGTAKRQGTLAGVGGAMAGAAVGAAAGYGISRSGSGAAIGGVAGGAAGAFTGAALTPSEAELFRKLIRKVTEDMPKPIPGGV
jgi:hypothetical protein